MQPKEIRDYLFSNSKFEKLDISYFNEILTKNRYMINYLTYFKDNLKMLHIKSSNIDDDLPKQLIKEGNCVVWTSYDVETVLNKLAPANVIDYNLANNTPITDRYIQKNLNTLTYAKVLENKANNKEYIIFVGQGLCYDVTNNNLYINYYKFIEEARTYNEKLDWLLAFMPPFQNLSEDIKLNIMNGTHYNEIEKQMQLIKLNQFAENVKTFISDTAIKSLDAKENSIKERISSYQNEINNYINQLAENANHRMRTLASNYSTTVDNFINLIKRSTIIKNISVINETSNLSISIETHPIFIKIWNKDMAERGLANLLAPEKYEFYKKALIDETAYVGVGAYVIILNCNANSLGFDLKQKSSVYQNRHWDRHKCLGTYTNPINDAKTRYDLFSLFNLLVNYIQTLTVGDGAGNTTLRENSYVVDKETNLVIYSPYDNHIGKKPENIT